MAESKKDLKQVGLTEAADAQIRELVDLPYLGEEQDVYRLAVAVAIAREMDPKSIKKSEFKTKWRIADDHEATSGTGERLDDRDQTLANLVRTFCPEAEEDPYRHSQYLAVLGINYLHTHLFDKSSSLHAALDVPVQADDQ